MIESSMKTGESLTIGFWFKNNYQLPASTNMLIYIGGTLVGDLRNQIPVIDKNGIYYIVRISSSEQFMFRGYRDVTVVLDDSTSFGVIKTIVAGILFDKSAEEFISTSENQGFNMLVELSIVENTIVGNAELLNALKGDKGDPGISDTTGFATEIYVNNKISAIPPVDLSSKENVGVAAQLISQIVIPPFLPEIYIGATEPTDLNIKLWIEEVNSGGDFLQSGHDFSTTIDINGNLILTFADLSTINVGNVKGRDGFIGSNGQSSYQIAVANGYTGTLQNWLSKTYTLDFQTNVLILQEINMEGPIQIIEITGVNVSSLTKGITPIIIGVQTTPIPVANNEYITWTITRNTIGLSSVGIKYVKI